MGFRSGAYARVWDIKQETDTRTKGRISISQKDKRTDTYEQTFSDFVAFVGTATAKKASLLANGARIRIGDCDVTSKFDKEKNKKYINFTVFSFDDLENERQEEAPAPKSSNPPGEEEVDSGEMEDERLPF